jgi:TorA maturation chaperone TorD
MSIAAVSIPDSTGPPLRDQARVACYGLIATLLLQPPESHLLRRLADAGPQRWDQVASLSRPWRSLVLAARSISAAAVGAEYSALFVGVGRPLIDLHAARYAVRGQRVPPMHALRLDLHRLRLARRMGAVETEDHLGALCETMRLLITGARGLPRQNPARQLQFFKAHIAPWYRACIDDIRHADAAYFYLLVADFIEEFFETEGAGPDHCGPPPAPTIR